MGQPQPLFRFYSLLSFLQRWSQQMLNDYWAFPHHVGWACLHLWGQLSNGRESWEGFAASTLEKHRLWEVRKKNHQNKIVFWNNFQKKFRVDPNVFWSTGKKSFFEFKKLNRKNDDFETFDLVSAQPTEKTFFLFCSRFLKKVAPFLKRCFGLSSVLVLLSAVGAAVVSQL